MSVVTLCIILREVSLVAKGRCVSEGVTRNGGAKYKGVAIFDQYAAIYLGNGKR